MTWWLDNIWMTEAERRDRGIKPPASQFWVDELNIVRVFDQLIYNTDRNQGNLLITPEWKLWLIDHTRAFRKFKALSTPTYITGCDRAVFERLKALDRNGLDREVGQFLDGDQIKAILARRDAIVAKLETLGPGVLFTR